MCGREFKMKWQIKKHYKKSTNICLVPRHLFQNPKVHQSNMGFSNRTQRFSTPYYLDVDSPLNYLKILLEFIPINMDSIVYVIYNEVNTYYFYFFIQHFSEIYILAFLDVDCHSNTKWQTDMNIFIQRNSERIHAYMLWCL